jgi:DNA-binding transcriptional MerR regulator
MKIGAYQVAKELGVTPSTIYNWNKKGLKFYIEQNGMKKIKRYELEEVKEWLSKQ